MEWWVALVLIFSAVAVFLATGMPVAFCFILINILGVIFMQGGSAGSFYQLILGMYSSVSTFVLLPIPLFVLMGEVLWHSEMAFRAIDVLDKWLGRIPGRLSILAVASGTVFASLSGSTIANTAMLGTMLQPELERRGYKTPMSVGPILASGGLAMMIPPSNLAVILAALGKLSVGRILIGAIVPGLIMAALYILYILIRCILQPSLTPPYTVESKPLGEKIIAFVKYLLPLTFIIFLVTGLIVFGVASPTESAALGCFGSFVLAACYKKLTWRLIKVSVTGSLNVTVMMLTIMVGSFGFSQLLAYSGVSRGLLDFMIALPVAPIMVLIGIQFVILFLGMFMEQIAIMMITLPIIIPVINALGYDLIWFGIIMLINLEISLTSPPFGILNFVMKGVVHDNITMRDIFKAGIPFILCDLTAMIIIMSAPVTVNCMIKLVFS